MGISDRVASFNDQHFGVKLAVGVGVLIMVGLLIVAGIYAFGAFLFYDSYETSYTYELELSVDGATEDLVVLVPAPVHDDDVVLGDLSLWTANDRVGDWEYERVDTEHGPMLSISISEITGPEQLVFASTVHADRTIETKAPRGVEPVLSPLYDMEEVDSSYERRPDTRRFSVTSVAYAEHGGSDEVKLNIVLRHEGANTWWTFGWSGNYYETYLTSFEVTPDPAGEWWDLQGDHREGAGSYAPYGPPLPR